MASTQTRLHAVELLESERIVPYGVSKQTWSVYLDGRWTAARRVPGAEVRMHPTGRGFVWSRSVRLTLGAGTRLELLKETPRPRGSSNAFSILTVDQRSGVMHRRIAYEVALDGQVVPTGT
jgi:hypothetical protein